MPTIEQWREGSRRGEVCGILGCSNWPTVRCGHCQNRYCAEHSWVIETMAHKIPDANQGAYERPRGH